MFRNITTVPQLAAAVGVVGAVLVGGFLLLAPAGKLSSLAAQNSERPGTGVIRVEHGQPKPQVQAPAAAAMPVVGSGVGPFNGEQKAAIETIVRDYFINNPEVFLDIQQAVEAKMEKIQADRLKMAVKDNAKELFKRSSAPIAGNPQGDITVVEFFDYNCGYCRKAFVDMAKLIEGDSKIKLVLKELPILSKGSEDAAKVALAAKAQGKYWEAHRALLTVRGELNEQTAFKAVEKIGLDMAKLKTDMESAAVLGEIKLVRDLAQKMGIQGTPHFLVGDRAIPGAPGNLLEQVQGHVAELRKTGCSVC
ncbi:MAG: DsbA family protein [Hyphomicrobiaceae bacterium]